MEILKEYKYIPKLIIETKEEIKTKHLELSERSIDKDFNIRDLKKLIDKIKQLDKNELKLFAYGLNRRELQSLILYMPENIYDAELWKVNEIINYRFQSRDLILFFNSFQNYYENKEFNKCFMEYIKKVKNANEILGISSNAVLVLIKWLGKNNIIENIIEDYFKVNRKLNSYLGYFGFMNNRRLYNDCWKHFLTVCRGQDYLETSTEDILKIIKAYELNYLVPFLDNYLTKLTIEDFQDPVLDYIYYTYDMPLNNNYDYLWDKVSKEAKEKYNIWYADKKLTEFFKGDERYEFWFRYIKESEASLLGVNSSQLFLDFGHFVVIEFRHSSNAAYIYSKDYYKTVYEKMVFENQIYDNGEYKNIDRALSRVIHREGWQYNATRLIGELKNYVSKTRRG